MNQQGKPTRFIRVRGRIIPVFDKQKAQKGAAVGAAAAGGSYLAVKYRKPIGEAIEKAAPKVAAVAKFGFKAVRNAPGIVKIAAAGAAVGAASSVKLHDEKGNQITPKLSAPSKDVIKRAALVGSGLGIAALAGKVASHIEVKGATALNAAREAVRGTHGLPLFEAMGAAKGAEYTKAAKVIFTSRAAVLGAGLAAGTFLAAKGLEAKDKKDKSFHIRSKAIGFGVAAAAVAPYYKGLSPGLKTKELARLVAEKTFTFARKLKP